MAHLRHHGGSVHHSGFLRHCCNVSGDNAIGVIVETIYQKFINKSSASV